MSNDYELGIIGGGPAGVTAAIYAIRYELNTVLISPNIGGWIREAPMIENYPGAPGVINGLELAERFKEQLEKLNAHVIEQEVKSIERAQGGFVITTNNDEQYKTRAIIYCTGSYKRRLSVPGEEKYRNKGVSYCVTCDGPLFRDKVVGVVGGGDSAAVAALMLSEYTKGVHLLVRDSQMNAKPYLVQKLSSTPNIHLHYTVSITEVLGSGFMEGVKLSDGSLLELQGLFVEIGMIPATGIAKGLGVETDRYGTIIVKEDMSTNISGFFAAGDVTTGSNGFRQIVTANAEGAIAANSAFNYLRAE